MDFTEEHRGKNLKLQYPVYFALLNANLPVINSYFSNSDNAFWDGTRMIYGRGTAWEPLTTLDIVAHEITHGITDATAGPNRENIP